MRIREKDIGRARVCTDMDPLVLEAKSPRELDSLVKRRMRELEVTLQQRDVDMGSVAVTLRRQIRVPHDFDKWTPWRRNFLLIHELVHVRQWLRYHAFGIRYTFSERFRWAVEVPPRREQVRAMIAVGASEKTVREWIGESVESMIRLSRLVLLDEKQVARKTETLLLQEAIHLR